MTMVHVLPTGDPVEDHFFANCPCRPRSRELPRTDGTVEIVTLHRPLEDADAN